MKKVLEIGGESEVIQFRRCEEVGNSFRRPKIKRKSPQAEMTSTIAGSISSSEQHRVIIPQSVQPYSSFFQGL